MGQDRCLYVFPRAEWQRRSDEVASSPLSDTDGRAYSRMFFGSSDEAKLDGQGRVTIPQRLREAVGIDKDVVVLGVRRPDGGLGSRDVRALHRRFRRRVPDRCARSQEVGRTWQRRSPVHGVPSRPSSARRYDRASRLIGMTALTLSRRSVSACSPGNWVDVGERVRRERAGRTSRSWSTEWSGFLVESPPSRDGRGHDARAPAGTPRRCSEPASSG